MSHDSRLPALDLLRFAAVFLVVCVHTLPMSAEVYGPVVGSLSGLMKHVGWIGVDLFFVISGFLISGLLFSEYKKLGSINIKQFLIRRGFKIYPAFYVLIGVTFLVGQIRLAYDPNAWVFPLRNYIGEIFFLQNYYYLIWMITWSLAIEEHFYLTFPFLLYWMIARADDGETNPFKPLKILVAIVAVASIVFDIGFSYLVEYTFTGDSQLQSDSYYFETYIQTHVRVIGLLVGVLISYYYHFEPEKIKAIVQRPRATFAASVVLIYVALWTDIPAIMRITNFRFLTVAFGLVLISSLSSQTVDSFAGTAPGRFFRYLGLFSYSIYLWHVPLREALVTAFDKQDNAEARTLTFNILLIVLSFAVGVALSKIIEIPFLHLRDRYFPRRASVMSDT